DRAFCFAALQQCRDAVLYVLGGRFDPYGTLTAEQAHRARLIRERRWVGFHRPGSDHELARPETLQQPRPERARLGFVRTMKQIQADLRARLVDRAADR